MCLTNGTSLSYGGLDVVLVPEQRHNAALHIVVLLFVRRGFDADRPTAKLRDDHPVGEGNAVCPLCRDRESDQNYGRRSSCARTIWNDCAAAWQCVEVA